MDHEEFLGWVRVAGGAMTVVTFNVIVAITILDPNLPIPSTVLLFGFMAFIGALLGLRKFWQAIIDGVLDRLFDGVQVSIGTGSRDDQDSTDSEATEEREDS